MISNHYVRGGKNWRKKSKGFKSKKDKEVSRITKFKASKNSHRLETFLNCPHQLTYDCNICSKHIFSGYFCCKKGMYFLKELIWYISFTYTWFFFVVKSYRCPPATTANPKYSKHWIASVDEWGMFSFIHIHLVICFLYPANRLNLYK